MKGNVIVELGINYKESVRFQLYHRNQSWYHIIKDVIRAKYFMSEKQLVMSYATIKENMWK